MCQIGWHTIGTRRSLEVRVRISFDHRTDPDDALARARGRKRVGRKHNHLPSLKVIARRRRTAARRQEIENALRRKRDELVAAYWRGEVECYPSA
jgi:hypothetical protein